MSADDLRAYEKAVLDRGGEKFRLDSSHLSRRSRTLGHGGQNNQNYQQFYHTSSVQPPQSTASGSNSGIPPHNERPVVPLGRNAGGYTGHPSSTTGSNAYPSEFSGVGGNETAGVSSNSSPAMRVGSAQSHSHSSHSQSNHLQQRSPASVPIRGMGTRNETSSVNHPPSFASPPNVGGMTLPLGPQMPKRPVAKRNASQTLEQEVQKSLKSSSNARGNELAPGYTADLDFLYNPGMMHRSLPHSNLPGMSMGPGDPLAGFNLPGLANDHSRSRRGSNVTNGDSAESNSHSASASVSASASGLSRPSTADSHRSQGRSKFPDSSVNMAPGAATMPVSVPPPASSLRSTTSSTTLTGAPHTMLPQPSTVTL